MIGSDTAESGFGISAELGDGDNRIVIVDIDKQEVAIHKTVWKFEAYVELKESDFVDIWYQT